MTTHKVEDEHAKINKVLDRIMNADNSDIDPVELCAVLVEMEERIDKRPQIAFYKGKAYDEKS